MNAPVFFQFELGRAKAQLAEFFSEIPPKGLETKNCNPFAHQASDASESKQGRI
jgi:hypothetical protein